MLKFQECLVNRIKETREFEEFGATVIENPEKLFQLSEKQIADLLKTKEYLEREFGDFDKYIYSGLQEFLNLGDGYSFNGFPIIKVSYNGMHILDINLYKCSINGSTLKNDFYRKLYSAYDFESPDNEKIKEYIIMLEQIKYEVQTIKVKIDNIKQISKALRQEI